MKNKKTLSMLALGLLLGGGAIGAMQVSANSVVNPMNNVVTANQPKQETIIDKSTTEIADTTVDAPESGSKPEVSNGTTEKDGINHQFEGEENNTD
jgi:hypothetical protein